MALTIEEVQDVIDHLEEDIRDIIQATMEHNADAVAADNARHAAEQDAIRIEGKLDALEVWFDEALELQKEVIELKAKSVLEAATEMVAALREEGQAALAEETAKLYQRVDKVRDPTSGLRIAIEPIVENLFGLHRENALTAEAYDARNKEEWFKWSG